MNRSRFFVLAPLLIFILGRAAQAAPSGADPIEEAKLHFRLGATFFEGKRYEEALAEYEKSYQIVPNAGVLFNIGTAHHHLGHRKEAIDYYRRYLAAEPKGRVAGEARRYVAGLTKEMADEDAAKQRKELEAKRAAEEAARKQELAAKQAAEEAERQRKAAEVERLRREEQKRQEQAAAEQKRREEQAAAEKKRLADAEAEKTRLADAEAEKKRLAEAEAEKNRLADAEAEKKRHDDAGSGSRRPAGIVVAIAGGVAALVGGGLFLWAQAEASDAESATLIADYNSHYDQADHLRIAGGILLGVGAVALVAGIVVAARAPKTEHPRATSWWISPTLGGLAAGGRF